MTSPSLFTVYMSVSPQLPAPVNYVSHIYDFLYVIVIIMYR